MRNLLNSIVMIAVAFMVLSAAAMADDMYPGTLEAGNLVCISARSGMGFYADRSSVVVAKYAPPEYEIKIKVIPVSFSDAYYREHGTYVDGPYTKRESKGYDTYRYNWNTKIISYKRDGVWHDWDCNRTYYGYQNMYYEIHAAETAFVAAYKKRFFGDKVDAENSRVISEDFYRLLNI